MGIRAEDRNLAPIAAQMGGTRTNSSLCWKDQSLVESEESCLRSSVYGSHGWVSERLGSSLYATAVLGVVVGRCANSGVGRVCGVGRRDQERLLILEGPWCFQ